MSADFESYEQDFAVLTADITGRIGKVPKLVGGIFARSVSSSPEVPVSSCGDGWEILKKRTEVGGGCEVTVWSSSDLRQIADGLLPPRWKKQDERCKDLVLFCIIQRDLLKSSDWFISLCCSRWTCCNLPARLTWRNTD